MFATILKILAALGGILGLAVSLFLSETILSTRIASWLSLCACGVWAIVLDRLAGALLAALPFGLAFGAISTRRVAVKAALFSPVAALLVLALTASVGSPKGPLWWSSPLQCGLFVALFCCFAVIGNRLCTRFPQRARFSYGAVAFTALLGVFITAPFYGLANSGPVTHEARLNRAIAAINSASSENTKFYALNDAAKESFALGHVEDARRYANELLQMAPRFERDWNYGNAIQDGNIVLGRIAVREGRIEDAKQYLLLAGSSRGSPQMNSFGPNMSLAKDLIEKGERDSVLQYFELCRKFWELPYGKLDEWERDVRAGTMPDFGANLVY